jgi:hypothetical protein
MYSTQASLSHFRLIGTGALSLWQPGQADQFQISVHLLDDLVDYIQHSNLQLFDEVERFAVDRHFRLLD